jgi:DNA-binding MarR family transcriptional regulator
MKEKAEENMENQVYDSLKIENQICFPLYACSREIIKHYKPFLDELDLTYTQYIAMMVLWQYRSVTAKQLGKYLYLDSGTLTPMLKKMEAKGLLTRNRDPRDERNLVVTLTPAGEALRERAVSVPERIAGCVKLEPEEAMALYAILYKILGQSRDE